MVRGVVMTREDLTEKIQCLPDSDYMIVANMNMVNRLFLMCDPSQVLKMAHNSATKNGTDTMSEKEIVERVSRIRKELRDEAEVGN